MSGVPKGPAQGVCKGYLLTTKGPAQGVCRGYLLTTTRRTANQPVMAGLLQTPTPATSDSQFPPQQSSRTNPEANHRTLVMQALHVLTFLRDLHQTAIGKHGCLTCPAPAPWPLLRCAQQCNCCCARPATLQRRPRWGTHTCRPQRSSLMLTSQKVESLTEPPRWIEDPRQFVCQ